METKQFTVHLRLKTSLFYKLALFGPVLFFFCFGTTSLASIKIALIDTGFCPNQIKNSLVKINDVIDLADGTKLDCTGKSFDKTNPRFHGHLVLEEFLKFYQPKIKNGEDVILYPIIVFDQHGDQKKEYWKKAINWVSQNQIIFVITAAGFLSDDKLVKDLPGIWFVPSGRITPQIKFSQKLFPQNLAPLENLFIIGDFYDGKPPLYDQGLLYQDKIDYYFPSNMNGFKGTSRAVAEASAKAISLCEAKNLRECLKKRRVEFIDNLSHRSIVTFQ